MAPPKKTVHRPFLYVKYNKNIPLTYFVEESVTLLGDLNQDSVLSVLDLILLINIILGNEEPTSSQLLIGDLNQDSIINILDIVLMVNLILSEDYTSAADMNSDDTINVLDIVLLINIVLGN